MTAEQIIWNRFTKGIAFPALAGAVGLLIADKLDYFIHWGVELTIVSFTTLLIYSCLILVAPGPGGRFRWAGVVFTPLILAFVAAWLLPANIGLGSGASGVSPQTPGCLGVIGMVMVIFGWMGLGSKYILENEQRVELDLFRSEKTEASFSPAITESVVGHMLYKNATDRD